jgi:hypothetical protein
MHMGVDRDLALHVHVPATLRSYSNSIAHLY